MMTDANEKIVRAAVLMLKFEQTELEVDLHAYKQKLAEIAEMDDQQFIPLVMFAGKILEGKRYWISSDAPETIERARSLAQVLGAVVTEERDEDDGSTTLIFAPPARM